MKVCDLRSDTITKPSPGMRKAMYDAEVGDDVYREDPSVNTLEQLGAEAVGKPAALFVTSGSMGNLIPIFLNCGRGNEVLAHERAHILHYEMASLAAIAGAMPVAVAGERGIVTPEALAPRVRTSVYHMPRTRMIEVENTHNLEGGNFYTKDQLEAVSRFAKDHALSLHMDGARLFNASVASGVPAPSLASYADTVTFCLSKGLGAPVGSVLCGSVEFIAEARRVRKMLGGGMRQSGILAAAGIYALRNNIDRLAEDHHHAVMIAGTLSELPWTKIDPREVRTNIIFFETVGRAAKEVTDALAKRGVLANALGDRTIRMVTSLEVDRSDVEQICAELRALVP